MKGREVLRNFGANFEFQVNLSAWRTRTKLKTRNALRQSHKACNVGLKMICLAHPWPFRAQERQRGSQGHFRCQAAYIFVVRHEDLSARGALCSNEWTPPFVIPQEIGDIDLSQIDPTAARERVKCPRCEKDVLEEHLASHMTAHSSDSWQATASFAGGRLSAQYHVFGFLHRFFPQPKP